MVVTSAELSENSELTDVHCVVDIFCRFATGCEAPYEPQAAVLLTDIVLKRHAAFHRVDHLEVTDSDHNRAHAVAALAYLAKYRAQPSAGTRAALLGDGDLLHAVVDACAAVEHGLRFGGAFEVVEEVVRLGERVGEDVRGGERFGEKAFRGLWRAYDVWRRVMEKVDAMPGRYVCARPGCGFRSMKAKGLRRCAGGCGPEVKPSYCSKTCQRKVSGFLWVQDVVGRKEV